jgi:hypothetical protein
MSYGKFDDEGNNLVNNPNIYNVEGSNSWQQEVCWKSFFQFALPLNKYNYCLHMRWTLKVVNLWVVVFHEVFSPGGNNLDDWQCIVSPPHEGNNCFIIRKYILGKLSLGTFLYIFVYRSQIIYRVKLGITKRHDLAEILLMLALNTNQSINNGIKDLRGQSICLL